jgi:hypothetical protein
MARLYQVTFRWVRSAAHAKAAELEPAFASIGNWARLNAYSWFVSSDYTAEQIHNTLVPHIATEDSIVIVAVDANVAPQGWAPQWFWEWINNKRNPVANALAGFFSQLPPKA